ncbi:phospholipase D1-like [Liolophura sinensis]|uniref:phospholipase D1-like n=1 Tax=Liolophura sinensis TaxID=3198878 RepID=UPI00315978A1
MALTKIQATDTVLPIIPFTSVHHLPIAFDSSERQCWIPGRPVTVKITSYDRQTHPRRLNPNLYTIEVSHDEFKWTIRRRYKHFSDLHSELTKFRRLHSIPLPTKEHRQTRMSLREHKREVSKFPTKLEIRVNEEDIPARMKQLEDYLNTMLKCAVYRNHHETVKFFGVSHLSFVKQLGKKGYESMVKKCSGGRRINLGCCACLRQCHLAGRWSKKWMMVKDSFVTYLDPDSGRICDVMLFDNHFHVECGFEDTGARHGVCVTNLSRRLLLKCWTSRKSREWMQHLQEAANTTGKDFTEPNQHGSFAPVREESYTRWFIDGATYFSAVADALEMAKEEIFITDWWLSPEIYLKRPVTEGDKWRLDMVLKRKADQGVKVFILLYKEVELALGLNSLYSKRTLCSHSDNIKVLRHPDHVTKGVLLWAHHEKIVVIDQTIAFVSGIDLCYGRWDDDQHRLADLGSIVLDGLPNGGMAESMTVGVSETEGTKTVTFLSKDEVDTVAKLDNNCNMEEAKNAAEATAATSADTTITDNVDVVDNAANDDSTSDVDNAAKVDNADNVAKKNNTDNAADMDSTDNATHAANPGQVNVTVVVHPPDDDDPPDSDEEIQKNPAAKQTDSEQTSNTDKKDEETKMKKKVIGKLRHNFFSKRMNKSEEALAGGVDEDPSHEGAHNSDKDYKREQSNESKNSRTSDTERPRLRDLWKKAGQKSKDGESSPGDGGIDEVDSLGKFRALVHAVKASRSAKRWTKTGDMVEVPKELFLKPTSPEAQKRPKRSTIKNLRDKVHRRGRQNYNVNYLNALELPPDLYRTSSQQEFEELGLEGTSKLWLGKDYVNFIFKDFENLHQPFTDFIDRTKTPRMPWHDIGSVVYGKAARDTARHFICRWNTVKLEKAKYNEKYPFLLPKCYDDIPVPHSIKNITFNTNSQILRSSGKWSAGLSETECSIHNAYIDLIGKAEHFIYIENQFFISPIEHPDVKNGIGNALFHRIMKAHRAGEKFRVYVVMPLLPGFEGAFGTATGTAIQAVTHWNYMSMFRGPYAIYTKLCAQGVRDPMQYISFYGLRTHSELVGELVTELIYVHCKLMIVDDNKVIIGSANVNDRSMLGNRDSEVAILVEDKHKFEVMFGGKSHQAGYFASSLRRTLFREHLGIERGDMQADVSDPVSDEFFKEIWIKQASVNTFVFEKVFNCIPTDSVVKFAELHQYCKKTPLARLNPDEAREHLKKVKGHLVLMPASFLCGEDLTPQPGTKEALLPVSLWT